MVKMSKQQTSKKQKQTGDEKPKTLPETEYTPPETLYTHSWSFFPVEQCDNDDPNLINDAINALRKIRHHWSILPKGFKQEQLKYAIKVAWDVQAAWLSNGLVLPEVPLAKNLNLPEEQDFYELEKWFRDADCLARATVNNWAVSPKDENKLKLTSPLGTKSWMKILGVGRNMILQWIKNKNGPYHFVKQSPHK
jgi:hypothetical protein